MGNLLFASNVALWIVVVVQTLFILALFRYVGLLLDRLPAQGPAVGKPAPRREVVDIEGGKHLLGESSRRHRVLIFTSPNCPWCEEMAPHIAPFFASLGLNTTCCWFFPTSRRRDRRSRMRGGWAEARP